MKIAILLLSLSLAIPAMAEPTVVFLPGLGDGSESFAKVARALQGAAPLYADARPDTMPGDQDGKRSGTDVAYDLHKRLADAGVKPPYILVGHSLGGSYALSYAQAYPADIAGVVLADARLPGFDDACRAARLKGCEIPKVLYRLLPASQKLEVNGMAQTFTALTTPASFGSIPISVIVATKPALGLSRDWQSVWIQTAIEFTNTHAGAHLVRAEGSRHYVQREAAKLVETEIREMLNLATKG